MPGARRADCRSPVVDLPASSRDMLRFMFDPPGTFSRSEAFRPWESIIRETPAERASPRMRAA